jgi:basic membrane lipoprotein Med (substrate-binding protein (PBP1-ABC) superfamily)
MKRIALIALSVALAAASPSCQGAKPKAANVAVFVPGVVAGSPIYEGLVKGVERAVMETSGASVKVFEAGFNQAEWEEKLTSLVATGRYDLVVTSNPSLPEICATVAKGFPKQKFLCLDGMLAGNPQIHTVLYNQTEQGYVTGYLAGLATTSAMAGANAEKAVGLIMGQHYPVMDEIILPGFERGLKAADASIRLDARVVGNWYDAAKAADLAKSMIDAGVDVILPICGGASQGVIKSAQDAGTYVVMFDGDEFARGPGTVLGCTVLHQEKLAYAKVKDALAGTLAYGKAEVVGMGDGYVEFLETHKAYVEAVPVPIRERVSRLIADIRSGRFRLEAPEL